MHLPTKLETRRLIIRKYEELDGRVLFNFLESNDNRIHLKDHVDEATTITTINEANKRIIELISFWNENIRYVLGIWLKSTDRYIGQIWIEPKKRDVPSFELGWYVGKDNQGQGFATEAVKRSIEFLFNDLNAHKIIVLTRDDNIKSIKLAERCGFVKEGHLRDHNIINGKMFGLNCYGLIKRDIMKD